MKYANMTSGAALMLGLALTVTACGKDKSEPKFEEPAAETTETAPAVTPDEAPTQKPVAEPEFAMGELIPPAPGEPGGLPDDRTPLDESRIDPESIRGVGLVLEQ